MMIPIFCFCFSEIGVHATQASLEPDMKQGMIWNIWSSRPHLQVLGLQVYTTPCLAGYVVLFYYYLLNNREQWDYCSLPWDPELSKNMWILRIPLSSHLTCSRAFPTELCGASTQCSGDWRIEHDKVRTLAELNGNGVTRTTYGSREVILGK